jgi:Rieske Fe-S protein
VSDCSGDCRLPGRRQFLKEATVALGAAMAALSATPREAVAIPFRLGRALSILGDDVTYPQPEADGALIDRDNEVILVRWKGELFAFALSCPHQKTALKWLANDGRFQCPKHKSKYQPNGTFISGRATRNMDRFPIRKAGRNVVVNVGRVYASDKQRAQWDGARVTA